MKASFSADIVDPSVSVDVSNEAMILEIRADGKAGCNEWTCSRRGFQSGKLTGVRSSVEVDSRRFLFEIKS